jgi:hypothetical protein
MGVELSGIQTYRSLRDALQHHVRRHARNRAGLTAKSEASLGSNDIDDEGRGGKP